MRIFFAILQLEGMTTNLQPIHELFPFADLPVQALGWLEK